MNENLPPQVMRRVMKEITGICKNPPDGIKVSIDESNITQIRADIDGPVGTPFEGGVFTCKLILGQEFPQSPPKGFFVTKIFHPNVSKCGEICVNTLKKDWKASHGISHILTVIRCLLVYPNPESALNEEAGKLLLESYEDFENMAKLHTKLHAKPRKAASTKGVDSPKKSKSTGTDKKVKAKKKAAKKALKRL